ncbi:peptidylprolyl isomerase [Candidatus Dojkabacteria bacterium]|nr:peptidylprolyl isomerase [Candidatus Dojkabacteria bacterium]
MPNKSILTAALLIILVIAGAALLLGGRQDDDKIVDNSLESENMQKLDADKYCEGKEGQKSCPKSGEEIAKIETNYGTIKIKFFPEEAPKTVKNFKKLVNENFYDGLTFHRIIPGFMIQGGDPEGTGSGGPGYTVDAEFSPYLTHTAGAVASARLPDHINPDKDSSGSQFYIVHNDTGALNLDGEYTIFAQVIEGMIVVEAIAEVETGFQDKPVDEVRIEKVTLETYK